MLVTEIRAEKYDLPLREPFRIALGSFEKSENVLVRVSSGELYGIGECAPPRFITGESQRGCLSFIESIKDSLIGTELTPETLDDKLKDFSDMPSARAGLDIALHDLIARKLSTPLYKLLGGYRNRVETDITIGITSPEDVERKVHQALSEGYRIIKLKVEGNIRRDFERVRAVGELGVRIRIDANQGFSPREAVEFIKKVDGFDVELIEQPVHAGDIEGLRYVRDNSEIPVFADESVLGPADALNVIRQNSVDGINIKLMKAGGITGAIRILHVAESAEIPCMIGCMLESRVSLTAGAHFALAFKNVRYVDLDSHNFLKDDPVRGGMEVRRGWIRVPDSPGLGIEGVENCFEF